MEGGRTRGLESESRREGGRQIREREREREGKKKVGKGATGRERDGGRER